MTILNDIKLWRTFLTNEGEEGQIEELNLICCVKICTIMFGLWTFRYADASDTDGRSRQNSRQASIDLGKLNEPQSQANDTSNDKTNGTGHLISSLFCSGSYYLLDLCDVSVIMYHWVPDFPGSPKNGRRKFTDNIQCSLAVQWHKLSSLCCKTCLSDLDLCNILPCTQCYHFRPFRLCIDTGKSWNYHGCIFQGSVAVQVSLLWTRCLRLSASKIQKRVVHNK